MRYWQMVVRLLAYETFSSGDLKKVSNNGEINTRFGVYASVCCGAEIVITQGATFPDCPNHPKLLTNWRLVPEEKLRSRRIPNAAVDPNATHIDNQRLLSVASGRL